MKLKRSSVFMIGFFLITPAVGLPLSLVVGSYGYAIGFFVAAGFAARFSLSPGNSAGFVVFGVGTLAVSFRTQARQFGVGTAIAMDMAALVVFGLAIFLLAAVTMGIRRNAQAKAEFGALAHLLGGDLRKPDPTLRQRIRRQFPERAHSPMWHLADNVLGTPFTVVVIGTGSSPTVLWIAPLPAALPAGVAVPTAMIWRGPPGKVSPSQDREVSPLLADIGLFGGEPDFANTLLTPELQCHLHQVDIKGLTVAGRDMSVRFTADLISNCSASHVEQQASAAVAARELIPGGPLMSSCAVPEILRERIREAGDAYLKPPADDDVFQMTLGWVGALSFLAIVVGGITAIFDHLGSSSMTIGGAGLLILTLTIIVGTLYGKKKKDIIV